MKDISEQIDFFVPNSNEGELVKTAEEMGVRRIILLYPLQNFNAKDAEIRNKFKESYDVSVFTGILLAGNYNDKAFMNAKNISDFIVLEANQNLRTFIDRFDNFFVYGSENLAEKDFVHQRDSGLNQVLATTAAKKNITFLFNLNDIINQPAKNKAILIGRFTQNIRLFSQYKCKYIAASFAKNIFDVKCNLDSFINVLRMNYRFD